MNARRTLLILGLALAAAACGATDPAALVASAKEYMAKRDFNASIIQLKNALQQEPGNAEARYLLGLASLEAGDLVSAEIELGKAQELGLRSEALDVALARTHLARGRTERVIGEFGNRPAPSAGPGAELRALVGLAHLSRQESAAAARAFKQALAAEPGNVTATLGVARLSASEGQLAKALPQVDAALSHTPAHLDALLLRAEILAAQGDAAATEQAYRDAIRAAPNQVPARLGLVNHLLRQRALDSAAAEIKALQAIAPRDPRTLYVQAVLLMERRDFKGARETVLHVLKVAPEHVPSLTLAGMAAYQSGAFAEAEAHLRKAVAHAPDALGAKRVLAATRLRLGQTEVAMKDVQDLLERSGRDPAILALAGEAHLAKGELAAAAGYYEKAKAVMPKDVALQTRLASLRFAGGEPDRAIRDLQLATQLDPNAHQADLALITALLRQRQPDKALEAIAALEKKQPDNPLTHNLRGLALVQKRDAAGARKSFEHAVKLNPTYMPAISNLARLDLRDKDAAAARKRYEAVLKREPNNEQALLGLAALLRITGEKPQEIEKLLRRGVAANPASVNARAALVSFHLRGRDPKAALAAAQEAHAALPNNPAVLEMLGTAQLASGERRQAIVSFQRLGELMPKAPQPHLLLARALLADQQPDEAIRSLRAALALNPDLPAAQRDIAAIYVQTGRAEEAIQEARRIQKARPDQAFGFALEAEVEVAQKNLGTAERIYRAAVKKFDLPVLVVRTHAVMEAAGRRAEADAFAEDWLARHPKDSVVIEYLADRDVASKRYASASKRYRVALERQPDNARLLNNLAWAANELKQPDALEHAERAHELAPENAAIMDTLGWILTQRGESERGLELLARATELAPDAHQIRLHFAKALIQAGRKAPAKRELEALAKLDTRHPIQQEAAALLQGL